MNVVTKFVKEAIRELGKVTWPTRSQVLRLTIGVVIISALFAVFVGLIDFGITRSLRGLLISIGQRQIETQPASGQPIQIQPGDIEVETAQ